MKTIPLGIPAATAGAPDTLKRGGAAQERRAGSMTSGARSTPAVSLLEKEGIEFRTLAYSIEDGDGDSLGERAARSLQLEPSQVFKTLIAKVDGSFVVAVIPVERRLDLKKLASSAAAKRATLADPRDAERITGYVVGGISPIGQRRRLRTFIEESACGQERIVVNAGRRGLMLEIAPDDLLRVVLGTYASSLAK